MKTKLMLPLVALALTVSTASIAQIGLGVKGGLNVSNLNGLEIDDVTTKALVGFHGGVYASFNLGRNFALQPELVYSTQGAKLEGDITEDVKINYMNIPVMVRFYTNGGLFLEGGPQLGFQVNDVSLDNFDNLDINGSDFAACVGLGYMGKTQGFGIGARYNVGLGKTGELGNTSVGDTDFKNGVFQLSLYLRLLGGGKLKK